MSIPGEEKSLLRRQLLARRDGLPGRGEKSRAIQKRVAALPAWQRAGRVLLYLSAGSEADTWPLLDLALSQGREAFAPRCLDGAGSMAFYRVESRQGLAPGRFGLWEPDPALCPPAGGGPWDLCLVPGVAFDRRGFRLGHGKGYYDRFLAEHRIRDTVGLCYGELLLPALPAAPHDQRVGLVVTEAGAFPCPARDLPPGKEGNL